MFNKKYLLPHDNQIKISKYILRAGLCESILLQDIATIESTKFVAEASEFEDIDYFSNPENELLNNNDQCQTTTCTEKEDKENCNIGDYSSLVNADNNDYHSANKVLYGFDYGNPNEFINFDVIKLSIHIYNNYKKLLVRDLNNKISSNSFYSKQEARFMFNEIFSLSRLKRKTMDSFMTVLYTLFPSVDWPIKFKKNSKYVRFDSSEDFPNFPRDIIFDVCSNSECGNCIFVGEFENHSHCPKCNFPRFTSVCFDCNAIKDISKSKSIKISKQENIKCNHKRKQFPNQRIYYRPMYLLIMQLLENPDYNETFLHLLDSKCMDNNFFYKSDISTGTSYVTNLKEMEENYKSKNFSPEVKEINLLISNFCDGLQLFKSKFQHFEPVLISILNYPNHLRTKPGLGSFMLSLHASGTEGLKIQRFLLKQCFGGELEQFYDGILFDVENKKYFVQIRLISTVMDTKATESFMKIQGTSSYIGCYLCNTSKGYNLQTANEKKANLCYPGYRQLLDVKHWLRRFGQSGKCCGKNFFKIKEKTERDDKLLKEKKVAKKKARDNELNYSKKSLREKADKEKKENNLEDENRNEPSKKKIFTIEHKRKNQDCNELSMDLSISNVLHNNKNTNKKRKVDDNYDFDALSVEVFDENISSDHDIQTRTLDMNDENNYDAIAAEIFEENISSNHEIQTNALDLTDEKISALKYDDFEFYRTFECCEDVKRLRNFLFPASIVESEDWLFYHESNKLNISYDIFVNDLWYPHMDYREKIVYSRTSDEKYKSDFLNMVKLQNTKIIREDKHYNGVKGIWPFDEVKNIKIDTQLVWDPFHAMKNFCSYLLDILVENDNVTKAFPIEYCKKYKLHPNIWSNNPSNNFWFLDKITRDIIEINIYELLIPSSLSDKFEFRSVHMFQQRGNLKGVSVIQVFTVLIKLILTIVGIREQKKNEIILHPAYKQFFLIVYYDLNLLQSPAFRKEEDIKRLQERLCELLALMEGLFPMSMMKLIHHQIYCISHFIENSGSILNFWALPGERLLGEIKECKKKGGVSFDYTILSKYSKWEAANISAKYTEKEFLFHNGEDIKNYSYYSFKLLDNHKRNQKALFLNQSNISEILIQYVNYVMVSSEIYQEACNKSKLICIFGLYVKKQVDESVDYNFFQFIKNYCTDDNGEIELRNYCINICTYFSSADSNELTYSKAFIYGVEFRSCHEDNCEEYGSANFLTKVWNKKKFYSAWFKYRMYNKSYTDIENFARCCHFGFSKMETSYGTFREFFQLKRFPDNYLNNLLLARATVYPSNWKEKQKFESKLNQNSASTEKQIPELKFPNFKQDVYIDGLDILNCKSKCTYIILEDVFPTRIISLGVDKYQKPLQNRLKGNKKKNSLKYYSKETIPNYLYFIELNQNNFPVMKNYKDDNFDMS